MSYTINKYEMSYEYIFKESFCKTIYFLSIKGWSQLPTAIESVSSSL